MARILLVDDDLEFIEITRAALEMVGHHSVEVAPDGLAALQILQSGDLPDLVISDVLMPRMDGFELLSTLRRLSLHVPVVFTSSMGHDSSNRADGLRLGALDFIAKPCEPEEMLLRLDRLLAPRGTASVADGNAEPPGVALATLPPEFLEDVDDSEISSVNSPVAGRRYPPAESRASAGDNAVGGALFPEAHVTGRIERLGLPALFALTEAERKSGVLAVRGSCGTLWLTIKDGAPWRAVITDGPDLEGRPAIFEALSWKGGRFEFLDTEVHGPADLETTFTHLLMAHAQLIDEGKL